MYKPNLQLLSHIDHLQLVLYARPENARAAQEALDGHKFEGSNLKVELPLNSYVLQGHWWCNDCPQGPTGPERYMRDPLPLDPYDYYMARYPPPPPPAYDSYYRPLPPNTEIVYRRIADPYDRRPQCCKPYYRERDPYARPSPIYRYRPYADPYDRRLPGYDPYYMERDPYARPPTDYYRSARLAPPGMYSQGQDLGAAGGAQGASSGTGASSMEEENRQLKDQRECKICNEREVEIVFIPCGHLVACEVCAHKLKECPICRQKIESHVRTYLS